MKKKDLKKMIVLILWIICGIITTQVAYTAGFSAGVRQTYEINK